MKKPNSKKIIILAVFMILGVISSVYALFKTNSSVENKFKSGLYQNEITDIFTPPSTWIPGQTVSKTTTLKNTGNVPMAVRASFTENWVSANGTKLGLQDSEGNVVALVTYGSGWTQDDDGYWYYGTKSSPTKLEPNKITTSFINGVKYNENVGLSLKETLSSDKTKFSFTSSGTGFDNATYTLTIKLETVQYDQAKSIWK